VTTTAIAEALCRDAAALLEAYRAGAWVPAPEEQDLAQGLAHGRWDVGFFRAVLRDVTPAVRSGRLVDVLEPAAEIWDQPAVDGDVVLQLRVLVDALTAAP
jgi:hypothetical protein